MTTAPLMWNERRRLIGLIPSGSSSEMPLERRRAASLVAMERLISVVEVPERRWRKAARSAMPTRRKKRTKRMTAMRIMAQRGTYQWSRPKWSPPGIGGLLRSS
ncbi:hypothetical protein ABW21_db0204836 [Orbilia brochopaga]|nr:hypothetical protein ABW21_db0204836 [Drechslerella brochopaga]